MPVRRLEFDTSESIGNGITLLGAFVGLAKKDFAVVWTAPCPADTTPDFEVDVDDLLVVIGFWGATPPAYAPADVNGDGTVDIDDLLAVISAWGPCP